MTGGNDDEGEGGGGRVVPFPFSRVTPASASEPLNELGYGLMARVLGSPLEQTTGHWCSRCHGIWYGYLLEVACPKCGNRHG
jgi:hypothetical protein